MRKIGLVTLTLLLAAMPGWAVRYGVKKQIYTGASMAYPSYLVYSSVSDRMYSGNAGPGNFLAMDCSGDSSLGPVAGAVSPYPPAYDPLNNRFYYKGGNETFYAVDCATNTVDTSLGGWQGGTWTACNPDNNKIYVNDDWNGQTHVYSAADYSFNGALTNYNGFIHYYPPTNSVYVPNANPLGTKDSLGVFSGATNVLTAEIYIPGMMSNFNKAMASNPAANRLYLSLPNTDQMAIVNTSDNTLANILTVGDNPSDFALCPINKRMFFACNGSSQYSLQFMDSMDVLDSVQVGDSVSAVAYNPSDSLLYIGCWRSGYVKLVDPRLPTPMVVDSVYTVYSSHFTDIKVDQGGDVYCAMYNYDDIYVIGKIPLRIWQTVSSGMWSEYWTWDFSDDGGASWNGNAMMYTPNPATDSLIMIMAGHSVNVDIPVTIDQMVVNGVVDQNSMVTVNDGPGDDILVNTGVYQRQMGPLTINSGAALVFGPGSQYVHQMDGDTIPAASWDSLSTINITGVMSTTPAGLDQAFGNLNWDCFQQAGDHMLPGGPAFSVRNLTISTTGPGALFLTSAAKPELTVENFTLYGANAVLGSGGNRKLRVAGDFTVYDPGWLYLTDTLNPGIDTLFLYSNYFHTLAGIAGGGPDSTAIVFCGADTQSYAGAGEVLTGYIDFVVFPGSHLLIPEWEVLGQGSLGAFKLMNGAGLSYSDMFGLYPTGWDEGAIRNQGAREYGTGANYRIYSWGTGPYHAGPGLPDTVNQLIIESYGDQVYLDKDLSVMDTLKLLANNLRIDGRRLSLFGPVYQTSGNLMGDGTSQLAIMGGSTSPVSLPGQFRDVGTLSINRPATVTMTDTLLVYNRLELINGTLNNGGSKLTFQNASVIFRSGNGSLSGAGPVVFVNQVGLEYGAGTITAGAEMPASSSAIMFLAVKGFTDTLIVDRDTLNVWNNLSLSGGIRFNGKSFSSYGLIDTVGPAGELILTDTSRASFFGSMDPLYLPGITGGRLTLDNSTGGSVMRRNITCSGPLNLSLGNMVVGANTLTMGDSLTGSGLLMTDSTSSLVFQGNAVTQTMPSTVNNLSKLSWDRSSFLTITSPLALHDTLYLIQGVVDNSANLSLRTGSTIVRNSGSLLMPPVLQSDINLVYGTHGGGTLNTGNELPGTAAGLYHLAVGQGALPSDTVALAFDARVNGRLSLYQGVLDVGGHTLTLQDSIDTFTGVLSADSTSSLMVLNNPYMFRLPPNITDLDSLILASFPGLELADTVRIRSGYRQTTGRIASGQLAYGPAAALIYDNLGADTTSNFEFPVIGGPRDLTVAAGALQLHADRTIKGSLNLDGVLNTGASTITLDSLGYLWLLSGYVEGRLSKLIPVSVDTTIYYELGTASGGYSEAGIQVFNNTAPAFVTAGIKGAVHPLVNDSSACLRKTWSFSGAGLAADASLITLNYLPSDFNSGFSEAADESTMVAGRYDNGATPGWQFPNIAVRNIYGNADGGSIVLSQAGNFTDNPEFTLGRDSMSIFNPAADTTLPYIASNLPLDWASTVGLSDSVRITFSEPVRKSGVSYSFVPAPGLVDTAWSADSTTIVFNHSPFSELTSYTVRVLGVQDTAGNALTGRDSIGFMTAAAPDTIGPYLSFVQPFNGQTGVMLDEPIMIGFSEPTDSLSLRFTCTPNPGGWVQNWDSAGYNVFLMHNSFLPGASYSFRVDSVSDINSNQLRTDTTTVPNPWTFTAQPYETLSVAWTGGAYKLFSVPVKPGTNAALTNLGDDLGAYSDSTWLMFGYDAAANSFPARPDIYNGYGYWLASANNATIDIQGLQQDNYSNVGLQPGWNLIGCPFEDPVLVQAIEVIDTMQQMRTYNDTTNNMFLNDSLVRQRMWSYSDHSYDFVNNGAWDSLSAFDSASHLQPWQGYAVYALQPCTLFMMPAFKSSAKGVRLVASPKVEVSWQAEFSASSGQAADRGIRIGISPQAKAGYDRLDAEKPPLVSSDVMAYIPHDDWNQGPCRSYQYDFRPGSDHVEWPLTVKTSSDDRPAELAYNLSQTIPDGYQLYLVDRRTGKSTVISGSGKLGFSGSREFAVIYTNRSLGGLDLKPLSFDLNQTYPNPFAQSITVNYQLAAAGQVSLKVYNVAGQLVRTLTEGTALPGYYSQTWNGRDNGGRKIASGVYIMRLASGGQERTRKLVKIK
ncbi:MAG: Ig-like domain-containing protein [Candidatus Edwardsbacteria bacterium]|nr:Ig-like domain-containing protein [Candidatus Edwardsbacteria bacterium]